MIYQVHQYIINIFFLIVITKTTKRKYVKVNANL